MRDNRQFGLLLAGAMAVLCAARYVWGGVVWWGGIGLGTVLVVLALATPAWLGPIRKGWMRVAAAIGFVNSRIILTIVFASVVTPMALWLRLLGKRPIELHPPAGTTSYWRKRSTTGVTPTQLDRQF